jgi:hypothetical protein
MTARRCAVVTSFWQGMGTLPTAKGHRRQPRVATSRAETGLRDLTYLTPAPGCSAIAWAAAWLCPN